jgi:hypothetical protein
LKDPFGHRWFVTTRTVEVSADEMDKIGKAAGYKTLRQIRNILASAIGRGVIDFAGQTDHLVGLLSRPWCELGGLQSSTRRARRKESNNARDRKTVSKFFSPEPG